MTRTARTWDANVSVRKRKRKREKEKAVLQPFLLWRLQQSKTGWRQRLLQPSCNGASIRVEHEEGRCVVLWSNHNNGIWCLSMYMHLHSPDSMAGRVVRIHSKAQQKHAKCLCCQQCLCCELQQCRKWYAVQISSWNFNMFPSAEMYVTFCFGTGK